MRKFFAFLFVFLLIAAGAGYLLYPTISDQIRQAEDGAAMKAYREKTAAMSAEQIAAMLEDAAAYNAGLDGIHAEDPFSAGPPRTSRDYQNHLNVHSGIIGELVIPAIGVYLPVYHNSSETPATEKLVHLETSSLPTDETGTSIVLAGPGVMKAEGFLGEIGLTDRRMLGDLDQLTAGDLIILNVLDRTMIYRIGEGLEEKEAIMMLSPAGVRDLDLSPFMEPEPTPEPTPEPRWTPRPTKTPEPATPEPEPEPTVTAKAKKTPKPKKTATPEPTPEPTPTPTPTPSPTPTPTPEPEPELIQEALEAERLTLLTPWGDQRQKLLVIRAERIDTGLAREELSGTDRATYPETWQNILLLGSPVLVLGLLVMFIIERFKNRSYRLPDEGRRSARRERKNKATLDNLTTESMRVKEDEEKDSENTEHGDRSGDAADMPPGPGGTGA